MRILILTDDKGGTVHLTNESPASRYGMPVLQIDAEDVSGDFGPSDLIGTIPHVFCAADVVATWLAQPQRTPEEIEAGRLFLSQWPEYVWNRG